MNDELIGKRFESNHCNWYTVIEKIPNTKKVLKYIIEFDEINGVKFKCIKRKDCIIKGGVKNPFYPSVCGIGYLGNSYDNIDRKIYERWNNMIKRCYDTKNDAYQNYGGIGVAICDRWLCYENFLNDFVKIEGYEKDNIDNLVIDKDIKSRESKIYSLETCMLVSRKENFEEMMNRKRKVFIAVSPNGDMYESDNQKGFSKLHNLNYKDVNQVLKNKRCTHKGWKFYFKGE